MEKKFYALTVVTFGSLLFEAIAVIQLSINEIGSFVCSVYWSLGT
jgi:hypothetical protein